MHCEKISFLVGLTRDHGTDVDGFFKDEGTPNLVIKDESWFDLLEDPECEMGCMNSCSSNCRERCCS